MPLQLATTGVENYLDESGSAHIKTLLLGEPGSGKTRSSSFWPQPIFAAAENGLMSVADRRVPYALIKTASDLQQLIAVVQADNRKPILERQYKTFVLDTLDALQQKVLIPEVLRQQRHDSMQLQDWGVLGGLQSKLLREILNLDMHVVVLCHSKIEDDGDGPKRLVPQLQGSLKDSVPAEFDLVGQMAVFWAQEDGQRVQRRAIKWHPDPKFPILKDRSGQLPEYTGVAFADDDFITLQELMFGGGYFEDLPEAEHVQTIPDEVPNNVVGPAPGGPVQVKEPKPAAKKAAAKPERATEKPAETATKRKVPPAKKAAPVQETAPAQAEEVQLPEPATDDQHVLTSEPEPGSDEDPREQADPGYLEDEATRLNEDQGRAAVLEPDETPEPTEEQAIATVEDTLGGAVLDETPPPKSPALVGTACGTPARNVAAENAAPGCGKDLGGEEMDYVNIAVMKFKTNLCFDCFQKARKAKAAA